MESLIAMTIIACLAVIGGSVLVIAENRGLRRENAALKGSIVSIPFEERVIEGQVVRVTGYVLEVD